jgi:hypothetical protein
LRYAHTTLNCKYIRTMVYKDDLNFPAKISVNGSGGVEHGHPVPGSQPGAGADLTFSAGRQCHAKAGRDHGVLARGEHHRGAVGDGRHQVQPGRELALVGRQRQVGRVREPLHLDVDLLDIDLLDIVRRHA